MPPPWDSERNSDALTSKIEPILVSRKITGINETLSHSHFSIALSMKKLREGGASGDSF